MLPNSPVSPIAANSTVQASNDDRLDSWKEIAAFLDRDVRTVQRWEKQAGLPIHRHSASHLRTAYAFRSELEAWRSAQRVVNDGEVSVPAAWHRRRGAAISVLIIAAIAAASASWAIKAHRSEVVPSGPPIELLLSRFADEAGDPALASLVEEAFARGLAQQRRIELAAPARVTRVLRLMRRDPATPLTETLAREVATRDGRIRSVIVGRLHKVEPRYFVDLKAIEPADGSIRVSLEPQAVGPREIVSAVEADIPRFAAKLLASAATSMPAESLEAVTTSSLSSLRLYSAAVQAGNRHQWGAAEQLARRAIAADDQFGSAYAWIGWAIRNQGRPRRESLPWLERAVSLSGSTSDRETYLISGIYHAVAGHLPAAIGAYEALLRLQPRDRQALDLLIQAYSRAGRVKDAVDLAVTRATYEPDDFYANVRAAHALMIWKGDRALAAPYLQRAQQLASPAAAEQRPFWAAWISAVPLFDAWMTGDRRGAFDAIARLEQTLDTRLGHERDAFATTVGSGYLAFGKIREAERAFRRAASPVRQIDLALLALALGDERGAREWLWQIRYSSEQRPALFARVGLAREAERGLGMQSPSDHEEALMDVTRGLIAARNGDHDTAVAALRHGAERLQFSGEPEYFLAVSALARILTERGDLDRALGWLGQAGGLRARTYGSPHWTGACWIKVANELASMYRRRGRHEEAKGINATLRTILQDANAEHPIAAALQSTGPR